MRDWAPKHEKMGNGVTLSADELFSGESKNIEYKVVVPDKSEKYMKTVVAFANTQGGRLVIGIDDKTHKIIGVDNDILFQTMDALTNAISDSCEPQIIPDIEPQTVEGKAKGTYIRVAGTSRPAHQEKISELEMEGARISWDELTCVGYEVTEEATQALCKDIEDFRKKAGLSGHNVRKEQLFNWKILKNSEGNVLASNAYVLLTSDYFPFSKTQCAVFKGTDRMVFLDKREYTGPIYKQIESAVEFVLRNIRLGATIDGLVRRESYELPVEAIREMIINAHCHRNLLDESCIQVAIYDDRLEVTSPGGLYNGLTYEEVMRGHSKIRNKLIANIFGQMGLVEAWGSGIRRIISAAGEYGLPVPTVEVFDDMFRVNLYRNVQDNVNGGENSGVNGGENFGDNFGVNGGDNSGDKPYIRKNEQKLTNTQQKILDCVAEDKYISAKKMAEIIGMSGRSIENNIKKMKEIGILVRKGSPKSGYWEIID